MSLLKKSYFYAATGHLKSDPRRVNNIDATANGVLSVYKWITPNQVFDWLNLHLTKQGDVEGRVYQINELRPIK